MNYFTSEEPWNRRLRRPPGCNKLASLHSTVPSLSRVETRSSYAATDSRRLKVLLRTSKALTQAPAHGVAIAINDRLRLPCFRVFAGCLTHALSQRLNKSVELIRGTSRSSCLYVRRSPALPNRARGCSRVTSLKLTGRRSSSIEFKALAASW
jgi:hypothetical protein